MKRKLTKQEVAYIIDFLVGAGEALYKEGVKGSWWTLENDGLKQGVRTLAKSVYGLEVEGFEDDMGFGFNSIEEVLVLDGYDIAKAIDKHDVDFWDSTLCHVDTIKESFELGELKAYFVA